MLLFTFGVRAGCVPTRTSATFQCAAVDWSREIGRKLYPPGVSLFVMGCFCIFADKARATLFAKRRVTQLRKWEKLDANRSICISCNSCLNFATHNKTNSHVRKNRAMNNIARCAVCLESEIDVLCESQTDVG